MTESPLSSRSHGNCDVTSPHTVSGLSCNTYLHIIHSVINTIATIACVRRWLTDMVLVLTAFVIVKTGW